MLQQQQGGNNNPAGPQPQPKSTPPGVQAPGSNEQYIWDYFLNQGFSPAQDAGILGNLQQESGFNPEAIQPGGPGRGLAQWSLGGRWNPTMMTGNNTADLNSQLSYIMQELQSNPGYGYSSLLAATNPQQAAQIFGSDYERYGVAGNRVNDASSILQAAMAPNSGYAQTGQQAGQDLNQVGANTALSGVVSGLQSGNALANTALSKQNALGQAQQGITDTQLLQQLQDTLKALGLSGQSLGIQQKGLQEQGAYQKGEYGLNVAQIQQALGNLATQYGLTKEGFGLQGKEAQQNYTNSLNQVIQGAAGSGITNTGSPRQSQQQLFQGLQNAEQGIGIQSGQAYRNYLASRQQYGDQLKGLGLNYGYQQQQLANQLAQLGISQQQLGLQGTEARQQYATGTQSAANQLADLLNSTTLQQAQNQEGLSSQLGQLIQQLQHAGMATGGP